MKRVNAFCILNPDIAAAECDELVYCGCATIADDSIKRYDLFDNAVSSDVYLPDMCDESALERFCDYIVTSKARAVVRAAYDLRECGIIEARFKLSPIMLLHKLGVLGMCTIAGAVCLDNDDLDLMAQEGVPLVITPTASAGYGHGFAPVCAAVRRGIRVGVGTFDGKYNANASLAYELEFLRLTANAEMSQENALSEQTLKKISAFEL